MPFLVEVIKLLENKNVKDKLNFRKFQLKLLKYLLNFSIEICDNTKLFVLKLLEISKI